MTRARRDTTPRKMWLHVFYATDSTLGRLAGIELAVRYDDRVTGEAHARLRGPTRVRLLVGIGFEL